MFDKKLSDAHTQAVEDYTAAYLDAEINAGATPAEIEEKKFTLGRLKHLGGSDMAAIMGLSKWKTPFKVWQEKTLRVEPDKLFLDNPFTHWGRLMEKIIGQEYFDLIGHNYGLYISSITETVPGHEHIFCNLDGAILDENRNISRVHEIKTAMTNAYSGDYDANKRPILNWGEGNRYLEDEHGFRCLAEDGQIPLPYRVQVETYMLATGAQTADISVLIGHHDFRTYTVHANTELQQKILKAADDFWQLVLTDEAPDLVAADYEERKNTDDLVPADDEVFTALSELIDVRAKAGYLADKKKALEDRIKQFIGDRAGLSDTRGRVLVTWKKSAARMKFDEDGFKSDHPDLWAEYLKPSKVSRTFLVKVK